MKYTGVVVTQELETNQVVSSRHTYYVQVEATDGLAAKAAARDRYAYYWAENFNAQTVKENWVGPERAPKADVTDILEGWVQPSTETISGNLHPVVIPSDWRRPRNTAPDPDARG